MGEGTAARIARARTSWVRALPEETVLAVRGADARAFLHRMLTRDVKGLQRGRAVRAVLLSPKGKVRAITSCVATDDGFLLTAPSAAAAALRDALTRSVIADDVVVSNADLVVTTVLGPRAGEARPSPPAAPALSPHPSAPGPLAVPSTRCSLPSVEWFAAGPLEFPGAETLTPADLEGLRIEQGEPAFGAEAGGETLPPECGLDDRVDYAKGCFPGQEPVARLRTRGHTNRGLAGILLPAGAPVPAPGDPVLHDGKEAGAVTSAILSPTLGRAIALALLRHGAAAPGTPLEVATAGGTVGAEAAALPFPGTARV